MALSNNFRFAEAEEVRPSSALDREVARVVPSLLSKTLSELSPDADIIDFLKTS